MIEGIILALVALAAGFSGARWQKSRQSGITKREAVELRLQINEMRKMSAYILSVFEEHQDAHKVMNHNVEILSRNLGTVGNIVGLQFKSPHLQ